MTEEALQRIAENKKTRDPALDLSYCGLRQLPSELSECVWLGKLQLSGNEELSNLSPLKELQNLRILSIANTLVSDLSPLKELKNLQILSAPRTLVSDLSPLESLYNLQELNVSSTQVSDLLPLKALIARGVRIEWRRNIILAYITEIIYISDCPLTNPPPEIVKQGNEAILQYFAEREKQGVEKIYEAKLVLIGEGRAGKTTLRDKLKDPAAPLPPEEAATKGVEIDIAKYQFDGNHGQPFKVNIWDFAGQEKYQPIHQFFYTHRALYVLVENAREQKTDFDFWLQTAELCSGGSPVLIVHNEFADQNRGLFQLGEYQGRYPGGWLKDDARVNFATNRGLAELERKIQHHIQQLPHVGEELPKIWAEIRRQLGELSQHKPYLTLEAYFDLCRAAGIPEEERALHLSQYLHILGAMLHYADNDLLGQFVILQNEWATDAAYKILDDEKITFETKGRFHRADLERIWTRPDYARMRPQLLELMKKFKLCYQVRDLDLFIAPQLLPATPPVGYAWEPKEDLRLTLQYEFMPKGLLTRFTVNRHTDIAEGQMLAWNSGVVLEWNKTRAEVTEQYRVNKGTIEIRVQGADRKGLMSIVDKAFDELHDEFKGIKVEKMVPCNCSVCKSASAPHFYKLSNLNFRREKGQATVECEISFENVNVLKLIENIFNRENWVGEIDRVPQSHPVNKPMRTVKIFLASSSELKSDREDFERFIYRETKTLKDKGIFLELVQWEDFLDAMSPTRLQDEYNKALCECDIVVSLFFTKVGKYTAEEFDTAVGQFQKTGKPQIFTYFKNAEVKMGNITKEVRTLLDFKDKLEELGHFYTPYESPGDLKHHFGEQLKKMGIS